MNFDFSCPVCGCGLTRAERTLKCENGHCFDLAKQGYVNLLQSQKSSAKRHGDDKLMVRSRFDFLNKGYYSGLAELIVSKLGSIAFSGMKLADLGCGECYYTSIIADSFPEITVGGIDISKEALIAGSKRNRNISLAVASTFALPISDGFCDAVVSVFAPYSTDEVFRVLRKGGHFVRVYPLEKHLMGLKSLIYEKPYLNDARTKMASRDYSFRDAYHGNIAEYLRAVTPEEFERFIGNQSTDFDRILEDNKDVLKRLKQADNE